MFRSLVIAGTLATVPFWFSNAVLAMDVGGVWLTPDGNSHVEIADCGDGTPCGKVIWIEPSVMEVTTDQQNPDETLRNRPLIGLQILEGFEWADERWKGGTIYDPEVGKTYGSRIRRNDDGSLEVKGCIGPICQTQIWTAVVEALTE